MNTENQNTKSNTNIGGVLAGLLVGGLADAVTALLFAPQSGEETRMQLKEKGLELRNRTTEAVEETMAQVHSNIDKITLGGQEKFKELKEQGQDLAAEQLDRIAEAAQAGKKAIKGS